MLLISSSRLALGDDHRCGGGEHDGGTAQDGREAGEVGGARGAAIQDGDSERPTQ
jgi:hypothetical protein